ncbi:MAG: DEAD/DEAH box helicase family protein [Endozoicomonadaceae bacterium]|nr:DEAD/DEAH box helicase family protein [Endozoicomonadaceae bacterium]
MAKKKPKTLPFGRRLVLNQWLIAQCGFDPLAAHQTDNTMRPLQGIANILRDCGEGLDTDNLHYFYKRIDIKLQAAASVSRDDLLRYEQNIVKHTQAINEKRARPIVWKYYQWLSLLFVEIYLNRYFGQREHLLNSLNDYIARFNRYWENKGFETDIKPYVIDELNKVCLQNATGSGKTLLMHVNFLQFRQYADAAHLKDQPTRTVLITPNESLSKQHQKELAASNIAAKRLVMDNGDLLDSDKNGLHQIDFIEITKLSNEDGPNQIAIRNLGDQNLLFVDEAHRGMGSKEETGWFRSRERLVEKGFVFEYSATFKEAISAAKRPDIEAAYAKNILFDYSYSYFYADGYGKDYRIFNLPKSYEQQKFTYLTACLLAFYQQLKLYDDKKTNFKEYNLEKPLWVFVGRSVSKATGTIDEQQTVSDVALIIQFIANVLKNESSISSDIQNILEDGSQNTGLLDDTGNDIFAESFLYIKDLLRREDWTYSNLLRDIFSKVFLNAGGGQLTLAKIKGDDSEIMLRVGQKEIPFGLINVGDASGLIKHIEQKKTANPNDFSNINILESEFSETLFGQVHESSSPVTVLLGSKKFVEGWDCWRVSTLGLMHVGQSEGSQIIQLFGRGVRLKGHQWTLKRSSFATPTGQPEYIQYLETLNVFGVQADFMERFKKFLKEEDLPNNNQKKIYAIPLNITYDFGKNLKVLRPRKKNGNGNEYNFKMDAKILFFGEIPTKFKQKKVVIDWYPRIQSLESQGRKRESNKNETIFSKDQLAFLDYQDLFFRLEKFKRERAWHNFNISKSQIYELLNDTNWYSLHVPEQSMTTHDVANIFLWQEMASELLQKYCDEFYNYSKAAFIEPRLELRRLTNEDPNIPSENFYQLIVDSTEQALIEDIKLIQEKIEREQQGILKAGDLKVGLFDTHLYQPVIHVAKNSKIQVLPVSLNESEFQFVEDLQKYIQSQDNKEFYLLRNESRGKGIGFFEAGNFYPDFLLWQIKEDKQYLAFIEPHGLHHEGVGIKKIEFHKTIKDIQNRLTCTTICLNSFIITPTEYAQLEWDKDIDEFSDMNVYFMKDSKETYISDIISKMTI